MRLSQALGEESVVAIVDEHVRELHRLFVCLLARAEDCIEARKAWRPCKLLDGKASVTWRDTIDAGSRHMGPRLKACWNPNGLEIDGVSMEIPSPWVGSMESIYRCRAGQHWYDFASLFGEVREVCLVVGAGPDTVHLVIHYASKRGPYSAYRALSGRCLNNPGIDNKMCVLRASYGAYRNLLVKAALSIKTLRAQWFGKAIPLPEHGGDGEGPIFELYPLRSGASNAMVSELLRMAPWGPAIAQVGKTRRCHLYISDDETISNLHAELMFTEDLDGSNLNLCLRDLSTNGTSVNEEKIQKGVLVQLEEGDVLRFSELVRYVPWLSKLEKHDLRNFFFLSLPFLNF